MLVAASAHTPLGYVLVFFAAAFAAMNVVGGYVVTDRMLEMFRNRPHAHHGQDRLTAGPSDHTSARSDLA
jgi:NAD(P) transhydrogenase subunit alpha